MPDLTIKLPEISLEQALTNLERIASAANTNFETHMMLLASVQSIAQALGINRQDVQTDSVEVQPNE